MEPTADLAQRFKDYQTEMCNHVGYFSAVCSQYRNNQIPASVRIAMARRRITVNDVLRDNGYGSSNDGTDTDSNYSERSDRNIGMIINAEVNIRNPNDVMNCDKSTNDMEKCTINHDMHKSMTSLENDYDGVIIFNMDIDKVNDNDNGTCAKQNSDLNIKHNVFNGTGDIPNSETDKNCVMNNLSGNINNIPTNGNDFVYTVPQSDLHNRRIVNNCVAYNVPNKKITTDDADSQIMNVDPTDSANLNVNNGLIDNDNF
ncbi:hypothetical protein AVEN_218028-1 [Araneus ventricosus]|uniref:Uncharacterized protein n=1 Tax=Araneus ventricosus TaxID=182803 RepID=A0A4Y2QWL2_ARAVE|nr:hypothetical protein AVEN_218028-1 [Araneus ventricosus]